MAIFLPLVLLLTMYLKTETCNFAYTRKYIFTGHFSIALIFQYTQQLLQIMKHKNTKKKKEKKLRNSWQVLHSPLKNYIRPPFLPSLQQIPLMFKIRLFFSRFLFSCQRVTHCQIDLITITDLVLLVLQGKSRKHKGKGQYRKTPQVRIY